MSTNRFFTAGWILLIAAIGFGSMASAETVTIKVGYSAGGPNDVRARIIARHLGKHLSGVTDVVVANVPGAGSAKLTKMLLTTEPSDGSVLGMISGSVPNSAVLRADLEDLNLTQLRYVGNFSNEPLACVVRRDAGINSIEDLRNAQFAFGATGRGSTTYVHAAIIKKALAASFDVVTGFKGVAGINSAILRGEIVGRCGVPLSTMATRYDPEVMETVILVAPPRSTLTEPAPTLLSLIDDPDVAEAVEFATSDVGYYAPLLLPAGTPEPIVLAHRAAFDKLLQDPEFRDEMMKAGATLDNSGGAAIEDWVASRYKADPDLLERARALTE